MHCSASRPYIWTAVRNILIFGLATDAKAGVMGNWHLVTTVLCHCRHDEEGLFIWEDWYCSCGVVSI
jgi:hypothetical protein